MNKAVLDHIMQGRTLEQVLEDAGREIKAIGQRPKKPLRVIRKGGFVQVELYPHLRERTSAQSPALAAAAAPEPRQVRLQTRLLRRGVRALRSLADALERRAAD